MSTTFIERFKHRDTASEIITVESEGSVFTIKQFAWPETEEARQRVRVELLKAGVLLDKNENTFTIGVQLLAAVGDVVKRHVKSVRIDEEVFEDARTISDIFAAMSLEDRAVIGNAYMEAVARDTKKNLPSSLPNSVTSSSAA